MKKSSVLFLMILTAVITGAAVFFVTTFVPLQADNKVIVDKSTYEGLKKVEERFQKVIYLEDKIKQNFYKDVDEIDFDDAIYKGLFAGLGDPYSEYMNAKDYEEYLQSFRGNFSGIGIHIDDKDKSGLVGVLNVIPGGPAEAAGVKKGDIILSVDGVEYSAAQSQDMVKAIRGEVGTEVKIVFVREGKEMELQIKRDIISSPAVYSELYEDKTGKIQITAFQDDAYTEFNTALEDLLSKGMERLIIDLRNNPGGSLQQVNLIADRILGDQAIEIIQTRDGTETVYRSDEKTKLNIPFVLLVNRVSASASEILAGAVKDTNSGTIIGETTYGKGIVQTILPVGDGSYYKITTSYYLTPNGTNIHEEGITPNIDYEMMTKEGFPVETSTEDEVLKFAREYLKR